MPGNPQPLTSIAVLTYRQLLLCELYNSARCVMSLDPATLLLTTHYWPVYEGKRVEPRDLRKYREKYQFLGPCCLCPLLERISEEPVFTEAAIYMPVFGRYGGEYVAECAKSRCGYIVPLQRIYPMSGVPAKTFPPRDADTPCPEPVFHEWELECSLLRPLRRTYAIADLNDFAPSPAEGASHATDWRKFVKLDSMDRPGLTESELLGLIVKCDACLLITTREVFKYHYCAPQVVDDSDSEMTDKE